MADIILSIYTNNAELLSLPSSAEPRPRLGDRLRNIPLLGRAIPRRDSKKVLIETLLAKQKVATTYTEWHDISLQLDEVLGNNTWKLNPESNLYDYDFIYNNLQEMQEARLAKDYKLLLYLIRTKWCRNLGNMGNTDLYRHSHVGTKKLIEEYNAECQASLDYLINDPEVHLDDRYVLGMLIQTRKNIGRTALVLSGGSTFGVFHIGVLVTLLEQNLLPRIISGSSAGSIIASILCCHTNDEVVKLMDTITLRKFNIFGESSDPKVNNFKSLLNNLSHLLKYGTLFDIDGLQQTMIDFVGDLTFREAYNRSGKILNITVSPTSNHELTRLINYLTAPHCLVWLVVCASCSLPGIFPSTTIYEKNPRTNEIHEWNNDVTMKYMDGSVDNDLPITRLSEMFNVDHIIAVQVNPHVIPMLKVSVSDVGGHVDNEVFRRLREALSNCYDFVTGEIIHYLQISSEMNVYRNFCSKAITLLSQSYSGDVTILPELAMKDFTKVFVNPTPEFLLDFIIRGARALWPKITVIRNHCGVEFALDKAISHLRGRLITTNQPKLPVAPQLSDSYSLVNSPVLSQDPETPPRRNLKRHNTIGSSSTKSAPKRNTISHGRVKSMSKDNSSLSLTLLGSNRVSSEGYADDQRHNSIRKAKSSVNFQNEDARLSPQLQRTIRYTENTYFDVFKPERPKALNGLEHANLPKRSINNSVRNSFIGLSGLKDFTPEQMDAHDLRKQLLKADSDGSEGGFDGDTAVGDHDVLTSTPTNDDQIY